jgi:hypothetical protein
MVHYNTQPVCSGSVGKFLQIWNKQELAECPRCKSFEDATHEWKCQAPSKINIWKQQSESLVEWLNKKEMDPNITLAIVTGVTLDHT